MAPESERATCKHERLNMEGVCPCGYWVGDPTAHLREPTLTCSEVVERLAKCVRADQCDGQLFFDRNKATAILHSWRERRVQELPILEKFEDEIALHGGFGLTIDQLENLRAALVSAIGKANYPRREQIRKGAKHESDL